MAEFRVPFSGQIQNGVIYVSEPGSLKSTEAPTGLAHTNVLSHDSNGVPIWIEANDLNSDGASRLRTARLITIGNQGNYFDGTANITYTLAEIGAVAKVGDTMSGSLTFSNSNIGIRRVGRSVSWVKGRDGALLKTTTISGYSPIISTKSKNGSWDIGVYDNTSYQDQLIFTYITDENYNNNTNATTAQIRFLPNGHIKADLDGQASTALKANQLQTGRTLITNLASTTAATFDGTANVELGVKGVLDPAHGGTGEDTLNKASNALINALSVGTSTPTLNDYYVAQYAGGGTTTTTYHRRPLSALYTLFKTQMADNGTASQAKKLSTSRKINGTDFDGTADITTAKWGTKRNITISDNDGTNTEVTNDIDGSANFTLKLPATIKASFTGSLTGDVTGNVTGTADSARILTTARTIAISGGATGTATAFDGSANISIPVTDLDVDKATAGTLKIARGGTNITTYTKGDILYASAANTLAKLAIGSNNQVLIVTSGLPAWKNQSTITAGAASKLATARTIGISGGATGTATSFNGTANITIPVTALDVSVVNAGVLTIAYGGTNLSSYTKGDMIYASAANVLSALAIGATNQVLMVDSDAPAWKDQSNITAGSASKLTTARTIAISGGATGTATSFDGSANITIPVTALDVSKANAGTLAIARGGTNLSSYAKGDMIYASAANTLAKLAISTNGYVLMIESGLPKWKAQSSISAGSASALKVARKIGLSGGATGTPTDFDGTADITIPVTDLDVDTVSAGTLVIAHGGTNITTYTKGDMLYASAANTLSKLAIGANKQVLIISSGLPSWGDQADLIVGSASKFTSSQSITLKGDTQGSASSQAGWTITTTTKHASAAHYSRTATTAGIIKVKISKKTSWMLTFTLRLYQGYSYDDYVISGYNYGGNHWYSPKAILASSNSTAKHTVTFGYDNDPASGSTYCTLWVSVPAGNYTGADVFNVTNGYTQIAIYEAFEIIFEQTSTGIVQTTVDCYRPWMRTEKVDNAVKADSASKWTTARNFTICGSTKSIDGSANVEWTADDLGLAASGHTHYYLVTPGDERSTATVPNDYNNKFKFSGLKTKAIMSNPSDDSYSYVIGLRGWGDSSGGKAHELAFNNTGIFVRTGSTTTWDNWYRLVTMSASSSGVGASNNPVYISNGVITAFSSTIGSTTEPVWVDSGVIKKIGKSISATVNSGTQNRLVYYSANDAMSATTNIYATTDAIAINSTAAPANSGKFQVKGTSTLQHTYPQTTNTYNLGSASLRWAKLYIGTADSYGNSKTPIYWSGGVPTAIGGPIGGAVNPVYIKDDGAITACTYSYDAAIAAGVQNRMAYYNDVHSITYAPQHVYGEYSYTIEDKASTGAQSPKYQLTGSSYAIAFMIGSGNVNRGLYDVTASAWIIYKDASYLRSHLTFAPDANATYDIGLTGSRWKTGFYSTSIVVGGTGYTTYNSAVAGSYMSSGGIISSSVTSAGAGIYLIGSGAQYARLYIDTLGTASATGYARLVLGNGTATGNSNNAGGRIQMYLTNTSYVWYYPTSWQGNGNSDFTFLGATSATANTVAWSRIILGNNKNVTSTSAHSQGVIRIYAANTNYTEILSQSDGDHKFYLPKYNGDMYAVHAGNNDAVGTSKQFVYVAGNGRVTASSASIGTTTQLIYLESGEFKASNATIGSIYNPVYLNEGVITELTGLIQKKTFTIAQNTNQIVLSHNAYTAATIVISIVVTSGERNLKAPISWISETGKVTLNTSTLTTGAVSGYIITARGVEL